MRYRKGKRVEQRCRKLQNVRPITLENFSKLTISRRQAPAVVIDNGYEPKNPSLLIIEDGSPIVCL